MAAYESLPRREKPHAYHYVSIENDSFILLTLLRGKNLNYDPNWLRLAVPHCFFNLDKQEVESIVSALNFEAAYKIVAGQLLRQILRAEKPRLKKPLQTLRKPSEKTSSHMQRKVYLREKFNIGSTLSFITLKEAEVHNLTALSFRRGRRHEARSHPQPASFLNFLFFLFCQR